MRIVSMTATFGKLEHARLTLEPGLNIIHRPNEWGKSTWCAFLLAMLYGLDTRSKSTRSALADKEHYAPWSGSPMSGRVELVWQGREITIERSTRGRIPMGVFRAYETKTGLRIPELTAENCGQQLLGVEQSVYRRTGFVRLKDLPVTNDDALRSRLQALVTTGDESGDAAKLERGLRELRNRCCGRQRGAIVQAQQQREAVQEALEELGRLERQKKTLADQLQENEALQRRLGNHIAALAWESAQRDQQAVGAAELAWNRAREEYQRRQSQCAALPTREQTLGKLEALRAFRQKIQTFREEVPQPPQRPILPKVFLGMEPEEALERARADAKAFRNLSGPVWWLLLAAALLCICGGGVLAWMGWELYGGVLACAGGGLLVLSLLRKRGQDRGRRLLSRRYGSANPGDWLDMAQAYGAAIGAYDLAEAAFRRQQEALRERREQLMAEQSRLCGGGSPDSARQEWEGILSAWASLEQARLDAQRAGSQYQMLKSMASTAPAPQEIDNMTISKEQTLSALQQARQEQQRLLGLEGECRGRMERLGSADQLQRQRKQLDERLAALEKTAAAIELAQSTLTRAGEELQRRFAPKITQSAQELLQQLTRGRYDRLSLDADMTLRAGACREDTLWEPVWRSEGTVDQLYLALRLAVAEALLPDSPLILDDALVRFDEERMTAALDILKKLAEDRQVLLFTCQQREEQYLRS